MTVTTQHPFKPGDLTGEQLFFIVGPCVIESENICLTIATELASLAQKHGVTIIFKASFDKANRTSKNAFRGPGLEEGLAILERVKNQSGLPITTDVHTPDDVWPASEVVDMLQIPAFLCRQTDLLCAASETGMYVTIKKGQFLAPPDMRYVIEKVGNKSIICERGTFFGYNRLVVDYAGLHELKALKKPIVFDATHSVQLPGGGSGQSTGNRDLAIPLANAALCQGVNGLFFEVHPDPTKALCDGDNSLYLSEFSKWLPRFIELHEKVKGWGLH